MDITEFREFGYLQEVNRLFFHPLGLALEVVVSVAEPERLGSIWDCRDDPEGINFGDVDDGVDFQKLLRVSTELGKRTPARYKGLGYVIQPVKGTLHRSP